MNYKIYCDGYDHTAKEKTRNDHIEKLYKSYEQYFHSKNINEQTAKFIIGIGWIEFQTTMINKVSEIWNQK